MSVQNFVSGQEEVVRRSAYPDSPSRRNYHSWISIAAVAILASISAVWIAQDRHASDARIVTNDVSITEQTDEVRSPLTGTLKQIFVKPGEAVKSGQLLAVVDNPSLDAALQHAQNEVAVAQKEALATQAAVLPPPLIGSPPPPVSLPVQSLPTLPLPRLGRRSGKVTALAPAPVETPAMAAAMAQKQKLESLVKQLGSIFQQASDKVKAAKTDLAASTQEAETARAPLDGLQTNLDMAKSQRDKFQSLYSQGIISRLEFQNKQADVDAAQTALDEAQKQVTDADASVKLRQTDVDADQKLLNTLSVNLLKAQKQLASIHLPVPPPATDVKPGPPIPVTLMPPTLPASGPLPKVFRLKHPIAPPAFAPIGVAFSPEKHAEAQAHLVALQAAVLKAKEALKGEEVRATEDGILGSINQRLGQTVTAQQALFTIGRPATAFVVLAVPRESATNVRVGQLCQISVASDPQERFSGTVAGFISPGSADELAKIKVTLQGKPDALVQLPKGTVLTAVLDTAYPKAPQVPCLLAARAGNRRPKPSAAPSAVPNG